MNDQHSHGSDQDHDHDHSGCADALDELYAYLDGECDSITIERIEIHLRNCSPCLEAFDFEAELKRVVASRCRESMPPAFRAKLLGLLGEAEPAGGDPA